MDPERADSITPGLSPGRDTVPGVDRVFLRCGPCHEARPGARAVLVGVAERHRGRWRTVQVARVGKGVAPSGRRVVEHGPPQPVSGAPGYSNDFACPTCPGRLGLDDATLGWALDEAARRGRRALYLPALPPGPGEEPPRRPGAEGQEERRGFLRANPTGWAASPRR
jgi:hypothetical protein